MVINSRISRGWRYNTFWAAFSENRGVISQTMDALGISIPRSLEGTMNCRSGGLSGGLGSGSHSCWIPSMLLSPNVRLTIFRYSIHDQNKRLSGTYNNVQTGGKSVDGVKMNKIEERLERAMVQVRRERHDQCLKG